MGTAFKVIAGAVSAFHANDVAPLHVILKRPDAGEDVGYVDILPMNSRRAEMLYESSEIRRKFLGRELTKEERAAEAVDMLVALTVRWRLVNLRGDWTDVFHVTNARLVYSHPSLSWIREQLVAALANAMAEGK